MGVPHNTTVGVIGLGVMGGAMARNLLRAGFPLVVHSRSPGPVAELVALGARAAQSPAELAEACDLVLLSLPDTGVVRAVLEGTTGIFAGARAGTLLIDTSTIAPVAARELAERAARYGLAMLDSPVSGGDVGAREATLTLMIGGEADVLACARPALMAIGNRITHVGTAGAGQIAKACNQIIVAATILGLAEALTLAHAAGLNLWSVREALLAGPAYSRIADLHGRRMIARDFRPGGRALFQRKDLAIILETGRAYAASLPLTRLTHELFTGLIAQGGADLDHSALLLVIERLAGIDGERPAVAAAMPAGMARDLLPLCQQVVVAVMLQAIREALLLAVRAGVDPALVREALLGGFAQSNVLETYGPDLLARRFDDNPTTGLIGSLATALEVGRSLGVPLLATGLVAELHQAPTAESNH